MKIPIQAIRNYVNGTATADEKKLVDEWYNAFDGKDVVVPEEAGDLKTRMRMRIVDSLRAESYGGPLARQRTPGKYRLLLAAMLTGIMLSAGLYLFFNTRNIKKAVIVKTFPAVRPDVAPGRDRATLTLADGSVIELDKSASGTIAHQGATRIVQLSGGQLSYNPADKKTDRILYNSISTPKGGQYELILPDGTRVWLNAASSLRFPTVFSGRERSVQLSGEGYFEVARDAERPFHVRVDSNVLVEVLGTSFNVNAYADENAIKTTLLTGMVKLSVAKSSLVVHPGQQGSFNHATSSFDLNKSVDVDQTVAWKNGLFEFSSDDIGAVMRQLTRWYDVETDWQGKKPDGHFTGTIERNLPLSKVLEILEQSDLHFKIAGKKIVFTP